MIRRWRTAAVAPRIAAARLLPGAGLPLVAGLTVLNLVLGLLPVAFVVATSVLVGRVPTAVADGVDSAAWDELVVGFALAALAFCSLQVLTPVQAALGVVLKRRVDERLRDRIMEGAFRSPGIGPMEDHATLEALSEATREIDSDDLTPGDACAGLLALIARYTALTGYAVVVTVVSSWWTGLAVVAATLVFRYGQRGGLRKYSTAWSEVVGFRRLSEYLREVAMGSAAAKELRVFGLAEWFADRYEDATRRMLAPVTARRRLIFLKPFLVFTSVGLVIAAGVLVHLGRASASGDLDLTSLALGVQSVVAALMLGVFYPEADVATQYGMQAMTALEEFEERVGATTEQAGPGAPVPAHVPSVALRFADVHFAYPGSVPVLDGLDLDIPAGLCTAVVGVNGAGKTTLVKLLTRLHEPDEGRITADGTDIGTFDVAAWRRQVSVIFQDFVRFELSAADNIALGSVHAPRDGTAVREAARRAGILDVLEQLPLGLDSPLSRAYPGGADLSGGQWQRVAIARSLYALQAGATVLVLDEPTSALDVRAEVAFFDQFVELTRGVTSILVSHRFSSVRRADHIVVLDAGRVVERGTHDELVAAGGEYARMFRLQADRFVDVDATAGGPTTSSTGGPA